MYERSAIVLERYFERLLGFNEESNLKQNFRNYRDLFNKFTIFQVANEEEFRALAEFQEAENVIEEIQTSQEKLYKKNAKLEYNRDLIFNDITQKPEEIEKCIVKLENDISKNQTTLISLREKFIEAIRTYNAKKSELSKCKKTRRSAESDYNAAFEITKQLLDSIDEAYIEIAKNFVTEENQENLISVMADNGKEEKIPFNNSVITTAAKLGFDILQREAECYLDAYDMAKKLINELLEGAVSVETHEKAIRNINVKLNFLYAEKEYLVQFLDYERITVMYGKRTHRTLMQEACEKFEVDVAQINNLYELLLKEIANKSTKKAYKELYNKSYLIDIEEKDAKFKKEKNKINLPVGTIMNSNYWRIESIQNIYTVFYKDVSEVFGKDLVEFDVPKEEPIEELEEATIEEITEAIETIEVLEAPAILEEVVTPEAIVEIDENVDALEVEAVQAENIEEVKVEEFAEDIENVAILEEIAEDIESPAALEEVVGSEVIEMNEQKEEIVASEIAIEEIPENNVEIIETVEEKKPKAKKKKRYTRKLAILEKIEEEKPKEAPVELEDIPELVEIIEEQIKEKIEAENVVLFEKEKSKKKEKKAKKEKVKIEIETSLFEKTNEDDELALKDYSDIEKKIAELDTLDDLSINIEDMLEDTPYEADDMLFEDESIFEDIENKEYEELSLKKDKKSKNKNKKKGIFNKIINLNSKEKAISSK